MVDSELHFHALGGEASTFQVHDARVVDQPGETRFLRLESGHKLANGGQGGEVAMSTVNVSEEEK